METPPPNQSMVLTHAFGMDGTWKHDGGKVEGGIPKNVSIYICQNFNVLHQAKSTKRRINWRTLGGERN
jgi:hypothetical protein